ncbi:hypothetical protein PR202_ga19073 [Eleusine coracana subsp. coracana]|uniref:Uncharacterized protein n=1 Tax=Eleusine coracana subsp. coracana TaxID=191504 RepID=A0AAV5CUZ2_ELECO|nr:hypothetical protein PR202_ga19073 [Eleusine coracana subsp. coracana]
MDGVQEEEPTNLRGGELVAVVSSSWEQIHRDGVFVAVGSSSSWEQIDPVLWARRRRAVADAGVVVNRRAAWRGRRRPSGCMAALS